MIYLPKELMTMIYEYDMTYKIVYTNTMIELIAKSLHREAMEELDDYFTDIAETLWNYYRN